MSKSLEPTPLSNPSHSLRHFPRPMNQRRPWLQRIRRRLPNLLPSLLLTVLYLAGAVLLAIQHCRLTSLLCLLAAAATVAVSRRPTGSSATSRSPFTPTLR